MADYFSQYKPPASPIGGNALLLYRNDTAGDTTGGTNNAFAVAQNDPGGALRVTQQGGNPTYMAASYFASDSTATDIWTLAGNVTTVVEVLWMTISTTITTATTGQATLVLRSAADTAGTTGTTKGIALDSRNAAASSFPVFYTAHPTGLGTSIGTIWSAQIGSSLTSAPTLINIDFRPTAGGQGLRLTGTSQILCFNIAAALGASGNEWSITAAWQENPLTS